MMSDEGTEGLGISEDVAHDLGIRSARLAVAEGDGAGIAQEADLRHLLAEKAFGHGGHGANLDESRVARAAHDESDKRDVVAHGLSVGHANHGGNSTSGSGSARRRKRFAMLKTPLSRGGQHLAQ